MQGAGEVDYEKELRGETGVFEATATLSKRCKSTVVCGGVTDARGHRRRSAIVALGGKIAGVSDMLHAVDGEIGVGIGQKVYATPVGNMGVVVDGDLRFPSVVNALCACDADFIVCPHGEADDKEIALIRAYAYCYGVPVLLCAREYCAVASGSGELVFSSPQSPAFVEIAVEKEYHLVETRRKFVRFTNARK
jgi:predicted amidohydrolase